MTSAHHLATQPHAAGGLAAVRAAVVEACRRAGRHPGDVTLVAASKTVPPPRLQSVLAAGHRVFGENRVQEAAEKWPSLRKVRPDVEVHLLGPLQTNKVRDAVRLFDVIHSVDRPSLCRSLARAVEAEGGPPRLFVQVNTGEEPQKAGVVPQAADAFIAACGETYGLAISGLMCVPPAGSPPAPHFRLLADIAARNGLAQLSMGMSTDFAVAIECGATHVRVGSAIFGARPPLSSHSPDVPGQGPG